MTAVAFPRSWPTVCAYLTYAALGAVYASGHKAKVIESAGDRLTQDLWAWLLLISGLLYVGASLLRQLDLVFVGQAIAAAGCAVALEVYSASVWITNGLAPAAILSGGLGLASGVRCFGCFVDLRKVDQSR